MYSAILLCVNCKTAGEITSTHPGYRNQIYNILRVPQNERVFRTASSMCSAELLFRPEQKNVTWMKEIIRKFTISGFLVVDCCGGTFLVAKACLFLPQHRRFVGFDLDVECVTPSLRQLELIFLRQVLNADSYNTRDETLLQAEIIFVKAMDAMDQKCRVDACETPAGFPSIQTFPFHNPYHLLTYYSEYSSFDQAKKIPEYLWTPRWRLRLDIFEV